MTPPGVDTQGSPAAQGLTRRRALKAGLAGLAAAAGGAAAYGLFRNCALGRADAGAAAAGCGGATSGPPKAEAGVARGQRSEFKGDAPTGELWDLWQKRGWAREAYHYEKLGREVLCQNCPHECLLEPEARGRCRTKVNKNGTLYTLAYGNPCCFHVDPIEKKPLYHFLPGVGAFSLATPGCSFRCLNCQNWEISQAKPESLKDPHGEPLRLDPKNLRGLSQWDVARLSMPPEDVVALAALTRCGAIAYTYSEPTSFYEYMYDTSKLAREKKIKNCAVTAGYILEEPLVELCKVIDAASVNLKGFDAKTHLKLNGGKLRPVMDGLVTMKKQGLWLEVINLIVPTYTDDLEQIKRMCGWFVENLGPDCPLHFLRFRPLYQLAHLPSTPTKVLGDARGIARKAGIRYVYLGGVPEIEDAGTTYCPQCKKAVVERRFMTVSASDLEGAQCRFCKTKLAGVWTG